MLSTTVDIDLALMQLAGTRRTMSHMSTDRDRQRVIFVCTHNSARSQMAEGMLRAWGEDRFEAFSAGTEATQVRQEAVAVMHEIGIDISGHSSKTLEPFLGQSFAWLITVCDQAKEACPTIPGVRQQVHWSIDDPSAVEGDEATRLAAFREARDRLRDRIHMFMLAAGREDLPHPEQTRIGG
jgi:arsenate reductase (thioredoxin)